MGRTTILLGIVLVALIAESTCRTPLFPSPPIDRRPMIILPTYRTPVTHGPIIRTVREVPDQEPLWLYEDRNLNRAPSTGDHPVLPPIIDDIKLDPNWRTSRSVDSPSAKRVGSSGGSSRGRDTGPTHPGYNRRNVRAAMIDLIPRRRIFPKPFPRPLGPGPRVPRPDGPLHIYARTARDVSIADVVRKPTHRDVIIPNWNPHARVNPWQRIGGNSRRPRSIGEFSEFADEDIISVEGSGYNRRNVRAAMIDPISRRRIYRKPFPRPLGPGPRVLRPNGPLYIYARTARDVSIADVVRKPTHRDVIIPNWNPHARVNPWQRIGGNSRRPRSIGEFSDFADEGINSVEGYE